MRRVEISDQVRRFIRGLAPDPRKEMRAALRQLGHDRGDIKPLEGPLKNYWRLRVRDYRVIFQYSLRRRTIECVFAERRELVYQVLESLVHERLLGKE